MKNYNLLGELLTDYRLFNNISQAEFAARMDIDVRTVIRWEMNQSLLKSEKEKELVEKTFIPYQVVRNLNAVVTIPTFYSFTLRKYALAERSNKLPSVEWIKERMNDTSDRIRSIKTKSDIDQILKYIKHHDNSTKLVNPQIIEEAARLLPELNLIIFDKAGYYSGHSIILPVKPATHQKLKEQSITESQLTIEDLTDFRNEHKPFFHSLGVTADCNENVFYIMGAILKFFNEIEPMNYTYTSITRRQDSYKMNEQLGMKLIWGDRSEPESNETFSSPRFYEGNLNSFFKK
jgi:transcriptional regulator with XRE-family HTH domain